MLVSGYLRFCLWQNDVGEMHSTPQDPHGALLEEHPQDASEWVDGKGDGQELSREEQPRDEIKSPICAAKDDDGRANGAMVAEQGCMAQDARGPVTGGTGASDETLFNRSGLKGSVQGEFTGSFGKAPAEDDSATTNVVALEEEIRKLKQQVACVEAGQGRAADGDRPEKTSDDDKKRRRKRRKMAPDDGTQGMAHHGNKVSAREREAKKKEKQKLSAREREAMVAEVRRQVALIRDADAKEQEKT